MSSGRIRAGAALLGLAAWLAAAWALDLSGGSEPPSPRYDALVVAGAGVMPGGVPSDAMVARVGLAVSLYRRGLAPRVVLTGGVGDWGPAEALVARDLALAAGVPDEALVLETESTSTEEHALRLRPMLGDARLLVVTDRYHALRCRRVFARQFTEVDAVGATSPPWLRFRGALREVVALAWYGVTGRL